MKALSVQWPWGWLLLGPKDVENRNWYTDFRGRCYIHVGKTVDWAAVKEFAGRYPEVLKPVTGAIIGEITIVSCLRHSNGSPWYEGPYGFLRENPVLYPEPIPCKGRLGFFEPDIPALKQPDRKAE